MCLGAWQKMTPSVYTHACRGEEFSEVLDRSDREISAFMRQLSRVQSAKGRAERLHLGHIHGVSSLSVNSWYLSVEMLQHFACPYFSHSSQLIPFWLLFTDLPQTEQGYLIGPGLPQHPRQV